MAYINGNGQIRVGVRSVLVNTPVVQPAFSASLLESLYGVWNGDTTTNELGTSLYGVWDGDNSSNDSVGTNHGTLMNGCTFITGKIGNAFTFDGINDYVQLPNDTFKPTGNFTISFWLNLNVINSVKAIFTNCSVVNNGFRITVSNTNKIGFEYNGYAMGGNISMSANTWYHVCIVNTGSFYEIYMNGVLDRTNVGQTLYQTINWGTAGTNVAYIGRYITSAYYLNGSVDSLSLWNRNLRVDEITQLYNSGTGAQYPFTGTFSSAGNQLGMDNGTLVNGCSLTTGKIGQSFTFDGVNDYVQLPNNSLNFTTFSISAWVNPSNTVGSRTILNSANYVSALDYGWKFRIIDGQLSLQIYSTGGLINEYKGGGISTNTWTHVSVTRINGSTKLYINGSLVGSQTSGSINNIPNFTTTTYCSIGSLTSAVSPMSFFIGSIDSLSVWQKELTQTEVTELYNSGNGKQITTTPIVQTGLVLNLDASRKSSYPNSGTTWTDISGNANNGTMVNGPVFGTASGGQITFDGINDYIEMGSNSAFNLTNITISIWVKLDYTATNNFIASRYYNTNIDNGWHIFYDSTTQKIRFGGRESSATYINNISTNNYSVNTWYNLVCTKSANTWSIYANGALDMSQNIGLGNVSFLTNSMQFGGAVLSYGNSYGKNSIGSAMIYNRALSASEVLQNFNATKSRFGL